jgi:hypothetical protein
MKRSKMIWAVISAHAGENCGMSRDWAFEKIIAYYWDMRNNLPHNWVNLCPRRIGRIHIGNNYEIRSGIMEVEAGSWAGAGISESYRDAANSERNMFFQ